MKTNVVKSLKMAEDLVRRDKELAHKKLDDPVLTEEITKHKLNINKLKENITKFMDK
jgi:hypothetical protein